MILSTSSSLHFDQISAIEHLRDLGSVVTKIRYGDVPPQSTVLWPATLRRELLSELLLSTRVRNCLMAEGLLHGKGPITVGDCLGIPNFGQISLRELAEKIERFLTSYSERESQEEHTESLQATDRITEGSSLNKGFISSKTHQYWERFLMLLNPLICATREFDRAVTLNEIFSIEVSELAKLIGVFDELSIIHLEHVVGENKGPISRVLHKIEETYQDMSETEHVILEHRMLRQPRTTLQKLCELIGVTRERVRQIQVNIERKLAHAVSLDLEIVSKVFRSHLGLIFEESEFDAYFSSLVVKEQSIQSQLLKRLVLANMRYSLHLGSFVSEDARTMITELRRQIKQLQDDAGLITKAQFRECIQDEYLKGRMQLIQRQLGLIDLFGMLGLRNSTKARAKAALIFIGRAASKEEIASLAKLTNKECSGAVSNLKSIVRSTKDRWALKEWVNDEYQGIVVEIIKRIHEDGGATSIERILSELPSRFGVSSESVQVYLKTRRFHVENGFVSLADTASVSLRKLDDVIHGRDASGFAFWTFKVVSRYFDGFSVSGMPPEFAKALGCEPENNIAVAVSNLQGCRNLSVSWRLSSTNGASLGYVSDVLHALRCEEGEIVRVTILQPQTVSVAKHDFAETTQTHKERIDIMKRI